MPSEAAHHHPPDLTSALIEAIPLICRGKRDVFDFFQAAGVPSKYMQDLRARHAADPESVGKHEIVRVVMTRLNEAGDPTLRERREVVKRVSEIESFAHCWPNDQLKAKGAVQNVREIIDKKDTFTRLKQHQDAEEQKRRSVLQAEKESAQRNREALAECGRELCRLVPMEDPVKRGRALEPVLNNLFSLSGLAVRESFVRRDPASGAAMEQVDGVIELRSDLYLVEMKWHSEPLGVPELSQHMSRVFARAAARGLVVSASGFASTAVAQCREWLSMKILVFCDLRELVVLLERGEPLEPFLRRKVEAAELDKNPYLRIV